MPTPTSVCRPFFPVENRRPLFPLLHHRIPLLLRARMAVLDPSTQTTASTCALRLVNPNRTVACRNASLVSFPSDVLQSATWAATPFLMIVRKPVASGKFAGMAPTHPETPTTALTCAQRMEASTKVAKWRAPRMEVNRFMVVSKSAPEVPMILPTAKIPAVQKSPCRPDFLLQHRSMQLLPPAPTVVLARLILIIANKSARQRANLNPMRDSVRLPVQRMDRHPHMVAWWSAKPASRICQMGAPKRVAREKFVGTEPWDPMIQTTARMPARTFSTTVRIMIVTCAWSLAQQMVVPILLTTGAFALEVFSTPLTARKPAVLRKPQCHRFLPLPLHLLPHRQWLTRTSLPPRRHQLQAVHRQ